jgi:receptor expression-enhancing protein 5/6
MDVINQVSQASGLKPNQVMQYGLVTAVLFVMFGIGQSYITNVIGVAYPAFMSFVALESQGTEDDKQWLTYWVCFGAFNIVDQFAGIILQFIPFYYFLKLGFLVYLFHPQTMGASTIYEKFILPNVQKYEGRVRDAIKENIPLDQLKEMAEKAGVNMTGQKMD